MDQQGSVRLGAVAEVRVSVATVWAEPRQLRAADGPALGATVDLRRWVDGLDHDERVDKGVVTQLLLGERVLIRESTDDGWVSVVALEQPARSLDPLGYPGWLPVAQLALLPEAPTPDTPRRADAQTLVVSAPLTMLHRAPRGEVVLHDVMLGTWLYPVGPERDGWLPVPCPGTGEPKWVSSADVTAIAAEPPTPAQLLQVVRQLAKVVYVWGGVSWHGIDCSGLVHLAWRRFGVLLPRDAHEQAALLPEVALGEERLGDLYFFARPGRPIHHVGIVSSPPDGQRHMIHACYQKRQVVEEPLAPERVATLAGVRRVLRDATATSSRADL